MATARSFLLIPVTLCFLLVLAAAAEQHGKATTTLLLIHGKAQCKSNPSRIISNAHVQLVINNATVPGGTGTTTSDGNILITVKLNSEQKAALMSNSSSRKAYVTAPPHACGAPSLPAGKVVAAEVKPIATITISDHDDAGSVQRPTIAAAHTAGSILLAAVDEFACVAITGGLLGGSLIG